MPKPGLRTPGRRRAAPMPGPGWRWMRSAASCSRPPVRYPTISMAANAPARIATFLNGGTFTPPAYNQETVSLPGFSGGNEWGGMTFDPKLEYLFVNSENVMWTTAVVDRKGPIIGAAASLMPGAHSRYT